MSRRRTPIDSGITPLHPDQAGPDDLADRLAAELAAQNVREEETRRLFPGDGPQRMATLARMFPTMRGVPGADPWNADTLIAWCNSGAPTGGSRWAARFLLGVWNGQTDWTATEPALKSDGRFLLFEAWGGWDEEHQRAALTWLQNPFWP